MTQGKHAPDNEKKDQGGTHTLSLSLCEHPNSPFSQVSSVKDYSQGKTPGCITVAMKPLYERVPRKEDLGSATNVNQVARII